MWETARTTKMKQRNITNLFFVQVILLTSQLASIRSQNCEVLSPIKMSPLDVTIPFKMSQFSQFELDIHKKPPVRISLRSNVIVELSSDKKSDKIPTFGGGGICDQDCVFKFDRLAFNWKKSEEHLFQGKEFPLESHLVFYNQK